MQVRKLSAHILRIPLRKPFRHASAVRHYSDNIVVRCELADGVVGWGEGVPREYVTGETAEGALEQFSLTPVSEQLSDDAADWPEVIELCQRFEPAATTDNPRGCHGASLRSAVELSLLDAFGNLFGEPVTRAIEQFAPAKIIHSPSDRVRYSTTIDAEHARKLWRSSLKMRAYGFRQCKVKVGADAMADAKRLAIVRKWIGSRVDLRVDANEAWRPEDLLSRAHALSTARITCIEQPLPHTDLAALAELRPQLEIPVMLDESLTSLVDAHEAIRLGACDLFNVRISKCGGLLNSVRIAALAKQHGLGYQLGCHPGETGILSAAGRHLATTIGGIRYLEGSYDRHVLARQFTTPDITFRYRGRASRIDKPGLGVDFDPVAANAALLADHHIDLEL